MTEDNKKLEGSNIIDARPQIGDCPGNCNECFYNYMSASYKNKPIIPKTTEAVGKIVRMNAEHDSNNQKSLVVSTALMYQDSFFNTARSDVYFPRPVVLTVNPRETDEPARWTRPRDILCPQCFERIMFVRYRTSADNYLKCCKMAEEWAKRNIPIVFTFMRYYDSSKCPSLNAYEKRLHFLHECWQLGEKQKVDISRYLRNFLGKNALFCGDLCRTCGNCEQLYRVAKERMFNLGIWR